MKNLKILIGVVALLLSPLSQAGLITDVVEQHVKVGFWGSYEYSHNLLETDDDPFTPGSALSGHLSIDISDDGDHGKELVLFVVEDFDLDTGGISLGSFFGELEVNALLALNSDGMLDVKVTSMWGDFYVGDSTLKVVTRDAVVPEPSVVALFGLGLLGLGFARRRKA